jgi:hypothetical protein
MSDRYYIQKNRLIIGDVSEIVFDYPIRESIEIDDMLIAYLSLYEKVIPLEENVFGVSLIERKVKWQIEKRKYPSGGYSKMRCPFVGIKLIDNELWLYNWCDARLKVDPPTGKVLEEQQTR